MNDKMMRSVLLRLQALEDRALKPCRGEVVTASPLVITLSGGDVPLSANRLASYTPTIGDQVHVELWGNDLIVLGEIV